MEGGRSLERKGRGRGRKEREREKAGGRRGRKEREEKGENGQMRKGIEGLCATVNWCTGIITIMFGNAMHTTLSKSTLKCGHFVIL